MISYLKLYFIKFSQFSLPLGHNMATMWPGRYREGVMKIPNYLAKHSIKYSSI